MFKDSRAEKELLRGFGVEDARFEGIDESESHRRDLRAAHVLFGGKYFFFHSFSDNTVST